MSGTDHLSSVAIDPRGKRVEALQLTLLVGPIALFVIVRLFVIFTGRAPFDSDEAILGLMALETLRLDPSVFFHGQDYTGSFQALVAAPFMALFGASPLTLRLVALLEGAVILLCWRFTLRRWGVGGMWVPFALLFALAPSMFTVWSLRSRGIVIESIFFGSLCIALLTAIMQSPRIAERCRWHWAALGVLLGVGWWTSQLIVFLLFPIFLTTLIHRQWRAKLRPSCEGPAWIPLLIGVTPLLALGLLMARGTVHYQSSLSELLFNARWWLIALFIVATVHHLVWWRLRRVDLWPLVLTLGIGVGYLPALVVTLFKPVLYNTSSLHSVESHFDQLLSFLLICGGTIVGVADEFRRPHPIPAIFTIALVVVILCAVTLITLRCFSRRKSESATPAPLFVVTGILLCLALFPLLNMRERPVSHYSLFLTLHIMFAVAWFAHHLWQHSRVAATVTLSVVLVIQAVGIWHEHATPMTNRMVRMQDQSIIDHCVENDIEVACSSLSSVSIGYWWAYRISFSSEERLIVHPVLHMPRVGRYREALQAADRIAVITAVPKQVEMVFRQWKIEYQIERFDDLFVIWDFDKARVDELGLISYAETL